MRQFCPAAAQGVLSETHERGHYRATETAAARHVAIEKMKAFEIAYSSKVSRR